MVANAAPRGVWWRESLPLWRTTRDAHNGASIRLVQALRASRATPRAKLPAARPVAVCEPNFTALRPAKGRTVAPELPRLPPRHWGDAPAYPVAPRDRTADPSTVSPMAGDPWGTHTAGELCTPPVAPPRELPMIRLTWCGAAPASGRWIEPLRFARTPRAPLR